MGILSNNQIKDIRFKKEEIILYNPTDEQNEQIKKIIQNNLLEAEKNENKIFEISIKDLRYFIRELTSIGNEIDELKDEELVKSIDNGNRKIKLLINEISLMIEEYIEDINVIAKKQIQQSNALINSLLLKDDYKMLENNIKKFLKKFKVNVDLKELDMSNPENLTKIIKEIAKQLNNK